MGLVGIEMLNLIVKLVFKIAKKNGCIKANTYSPRW
jgi:hypothetical protein